MKRMIFLVVALVAIVAGANADDRTKISKVEGTSKNFDAIPRLGNPITQPTFIVTTGAPAYFNKGDSYWQKLVDGKWKISNSGTFTEGTWRYHTSVIINNTTDPDNEFVLNNSTQIKVNGIRWESFPAVLKGNSSWVVVFSPTITLSRSKVSLVEGTSKNLDAIPRLGNPITQPTFIVTTGAPAYFNKGDSFWQKLVDGKWKISNSGTFTEGTWRYHTSVIINSTTDSDNEFVLDKNALIKVNGIRWEHYGVVINDVSSWVVIYSPTYIVDSRTKITQVEGKSTDLTTISVYGESVTKKPTITVTKGAPAYFKTNLLNAVWQKKVDDKWEDVPKGTFTEGTWRFKYKVSIDETTDPDNQYALDRNVSVTINGTEWERQDYVCKEDYSYVTVTSPEIGVDKADTRTKITSVIATSSDLTTIPVAGEPVKKPTFTVTTGAPAYFNTNYLNDNWQKKVDDKWQIVSSGTFTEGTWRLVCQVRIDEKTDPDNQYLLSRNATVTVNGTEWENRGYVDWDDYSYMAIASPEMEIVFEENRSKIATVQGSSSDFASIPVLGEPLTKPTIDSESLYAYFNIDDENGWWQKKIDGQWRDVKSGSFSEGSWRFKCEVRIDDTTDPDNGHVLTDNAKVRVNGMIWGKETVFADYKYSSVAVYSPAIELSEELVRTEVVMVEATCPLLTTIPRKGVPVTTKPTITVKSGAPAFFNINEYNGWWQKKIDGQWQDVQEGVFDAGSWRFCCQVRIDSSTDPDNKNVLSDDLGVMVNETLWGRQSLQVQDTYSYVFVTSQSIDVEETRRFEWYGENGIARVETGFGDGTNDEGVWYASNDGSSYVEWDCEETPGVYPDNELVQAYGGISGTAVLNGSDPEQDPFVDISFEVVGPALVADVSEWGGIAIAYTSDVAPILELGLEPTVEYNMDYARPQVKLPASPISTTFVRLDWSDFELPDWYTGFEEMSGAEAAQQLCTVRFKVQGATDNRYHFNIVAIGSRDMSNNGNLPEPGLEKCATPTITYKDGKLSFDCETEGVQFVYRITAEDSQDGNSDGVSLTGVYRVDVYATKNGMSNSDTATEEIKVAGKMGDMNEDGVLSVTDVGILITKILQAP